MNYKKNYIITGVLFCAFLIFTFLVCLIDVQQVGPENSSVGLATLNVWMHDKIGVHMLWYSITKYLGLVPILVVPVFGLLGLIQMIQRKSLLKVDLDLLFMGIYYVIVAITYVFFEIVIINYRPIILDEGLEASYPSSHTILVISIIGAAMIECSNRVKNNAARTTVMAISSIVILLMVVGRLISGVHWFTDIIGGILIGATLVMLYYSIYKQCRNSNKHSV